MPQPGSRRRAPFGPLLCLLAAGCVGASPEPGSSSPKGAAGPISVDLAPLRDAADNAAFLEEARAAGLRVDGFGVRVTILTRDLAPADRPRFEHAAVRVRHFAPDLERVLASVRDRRGLDALARIPLVRRIEPERGPAPKPGSGAAQ
jgi:hypothetical protein